MYTYLKQHTILCLFFGDFLWIIIIITVLVYIAKNILVPTLTENKHIIQKHILNQQPQTNKAALFMIPNLIVNY